MNKTVFRVAKMDCSAEEQLIRLKFGGHEAVASLLFDLPARRLTIFHTGTVAPLARTLDGLRLDSSFVATEDVGLAELTEDAPTDRQLLWTVLLINAFFFLLEVGAGLVAHSMGLVADALDMLADALVYGLALYAVTQVVSTQKRVARLSGYFQLALAIGGLVEVVRRFVVGEQAPRFGLMMGISALALAGNAVSLYLLQKSRSQQAHMQASQVFTSNDVIVNLGVLVAGGLVYVTGSALPDLLIGLAVFGLVARGAFRIFQLAK